MSNSFPKFYHLPIFSQSFFLKSKSRKRYFKMLRRPDYIHNNRRTIFDGYVEFKFPDIYNGSDFSTVEGKFLRIRPKHERVTVEEGQIEDIANRLAATAHACGFSGKDYSDTDIKALCKSAVIFSAYFFPFGGFEGKEFEFVLRTFLLVWLYDEAMEEAWDDGIYSKSSGAVNELVDVHSAFLGHLSSSSFATPENLSSVKFPHFQRISKFIKCIAELGEEMSGGGKEYEQRIQPLVLSFEEEFNCNAWFAVRKVDESYSIRLFDFWRTGNSAYSPALEAMAFALKIFIPKEIRRHPCFTKMVSITAANLAYVNDILGIRKDFGVTSSDPPPDNQIVFRVIEKREKLEDVILDMCQLADENLHDLNVLKETLLAIYGEQSCLISYMEVIDAVIDGHNKTYATNTRYNTNRGYIKLSRDNSTIL